MPIQRFSAGLLAGRWTARETKGQQMGSQLIDIVCEESSFYDERRGRFRFGVTGGDERGRSKSSRPEWASGALVGPSPQGVL
jgi:hypothetical protein